MVHFRNDLERRLGQGLEIRDLEDKASGAGAVIGVDDSGMARSLRWRVLSNIHNILRSRNRYDYILK
jgi:hypothetical protein